MAYFLGLILALVPAYLVRFKILGMPTTMLEVMVVIFLILSVVRLKILDLKKIQSLGQINYAVGLLLLAGIISTLVSPEQTKALGQLKAFIVEPILLFYAAVLTIKTEDDLRAVLKWLFWGTVLVSIFGLVQYFTLIRLPLRFWGTGAESLRITSIFEYPNALSLYLAPLLGFFVVLWDRGFQVFKNKWVALAGIISMAMALLLTASRGAWFGVILVLLLYFAKKYGMKKILIPSAIILLILFLIPSIQQRILLGFSDPSSSAHLDLIKFGANEILQEPFLGNGLAGFARFNLGVNYPHNIFLNFWLELGLLGLIAFAWIIFLASDKHKSKPTTLTLAAGVYIAIMLVHGLVDVPYFKNDLSVLFWIVLSFFYLFLPS